jgi:hypothetical protein
LEALFFCVLRFPGTAETVDEARVRYG